MIQLVYLVHLIVYFGQGVKLGCLCIFWKEEFKCIPVEEAFLKHARQVIYHLLQKVFSWSFDDFL